MLDDRAFIFAQINYLAELVEDAEVDFALAFFAAFLVDFLVVLAAFLVSLAAFLVDFLVTIEFSRLLSSFWCGKFKLFS
ncbi:hypothetical protein ACIA4B_04550 [Lactobacillus delbrueckii subsp. bulgaricus]